MLLNYRSGTVPVQSLRTQADLCPNRVISGRHRLKLAEPDSSLAEMGPKPAEIGRGRAKCAQHSAEFGRDRPLRSIRLWAWGAANRTN